MKVLHIANMNLRSGVASFLMNYYCHIDRNKIQFDFLSCALLKENYLEEINGLGGHLFNAPNYKKDIIGYIRYINAVMKNGSYDIIHCHQFLLSIIALVLAKRNGIGIRILHSHSSSISSKGKRALVCICRNIWRFLVTDFFACSKEAALFLFGKRYTFKIMSNAIEVERYNFNERYRNAIRNDLRMPLNAFIVGYVARFVKEKNHLFLINIFKNVLLKDTNSYLLLVGNGELFDEVKRYAAGLNLSDNIIFYGVSERAYELYSAMDIFVFPSSFEGLGIVGIEAQCAGLPVLASTAIPRTMQVTDLVCWFDLKNGPEKWAEKILEYRLPGKRRNMAATITKNGYNIRQECRKLEEEYTLLVKNAG